MANFCSDCGRSVLQNARFCTSCGAAIEGVQPAEVNRQNKRDKVLGRQRPKRTNRLRTAIIIGIVLLFGGWLYANLPERANPKIEAQPVVASSINYSRSGQQMFDIPSKVENGKIVISLDVVKEKKFVAFNYVSPKNTVPLLAYISGEGKLVTAVSMCEPCNSKRFHIKAEELVCNACGSTWELDNLQAISGACGKYPPDAIPSVVVGNEVQIDEAIVARWQRRI